MNKPRKYYITILMFAAVVIYHLPIWVQGSGTWFRVVDFLNNYVVWQKLATQQPWALQGNDAIVEAYMSGMPMYTMASKHSLVWWLYYLLPDFGALVVHSIFIQVVAMVGMYYLIVDYMLPKQKKIAVAVAIMYGFTPFMQHWSLGVAAIPALAWVFGNIMHGHKKWLSILVLLLYPLASNLQSVGVFVLAGWIVAAVYIWRKYKVGLWNLIWPVALLSTTFVLLKLQLLMNVLFQKNFISNRIKFKHFAEGGAIDFFKRFFNYLFIQSSGSLYFHQQIMAVMLVVTIIWNRKIKTKQIERLKWLCLCIVVISFYLASINTSLVCNMRNNYYLLRAFSIERVYVLLPLLWFVALAICMYVWLQAYPKLQLAVYGFAALQLAWVLAHNSSWQGLAGSKMAARNSRPYNSFYAADLFAEIKSKLPKPLSQFRVASFGLPAAVAQYNGLYTVDGILPSYPLSYKQQFAAINKYDLDKMEATEMHENYGFTYWGSVCGLFSSQLPHQYWFKPALDKYEPTYTIPKVFWNLDVLKQLNCAYIISTVLIANLNGTGLEQMHMFENETYKIYLYKIKL